MSERRRVLLGVIAVVMVLLVVGSGLVTTAMIANYQNVGTLTRVISLIEKNYLEKVTAATLVEGAVKGVVESLDDPYSVYMPAKEFKKLQEQVKGFFGGIGIFVDTRGDQLTVAKPIEGTPAYKKGIKSGDVIVKINDKETKGMDPDVAINMMRGPVGTKVKLVVFRKSAHKMLTFEITREEIEVPTVEGKILPGTDIAYIQLSLFTTVTDNELGNVLKKLIKERTGKEVSPANFQDFKGELKKSGILGIILDLRDNPGGELEAATRVADLFIPKGPIVFIDYRAGEDEIHEADDNRIDLPLAVLVNGGSASASEIVAGAVKDTKAGTVVGTKTFGKGVVQSIFPLQNDAGLKLTTARYLTPQKHDINKKGITPDVVVEIPEEAAPGTEKYDEGKDAQLQKAVSILQEKINR
ncbi:MAG: S41 family peptidase [Bacillota bacterium]